MLGYSVSLCVHIIRIVDMPAHIKTVLIGESLSIPVSDGFLMLGTWQGIYLCEHRNSGSSRRIVATLQGERRNPL